MIIRSSESTDLQKCCQGPDNWAQRLGVGMAMDSWHRAALFARLDSDAQFNDI
jgi:hypothetical protein